MDRILNDLGIVDVSGFNIPITSIPKQRFDGTIKGIDGSHRCRLEYKKIVDNGEYGLIQRCVRFQGTKKQHCVIKRPRSPCIPLQLEGAIQALCFSTLMKFNLVGSVPEVYDIFVFGDEVRFTMEWIDGLNFSSFLEKVPTANLESIFLNCILQLSFILYILEKEIGCDHRDLNSGNIWIRQRSQEYRLVIEEKEYHIKFDYQVVILDFGFACLGNSITRKSSVSLGNGVIPPLDPCPKEGRDMYHILNRLLSLPFIYNRLSSTLMDTIKGWMKPYTVRDPYLTQLITSDPKFEIKLLNARNFIESFAESL